MSARAAIALLGSCAALLARPLAAAETFDIGLATSGARIDAVAVDARKDSAPTVVLVGGLSGEDAGADAVRAAVAAYERSRKRPVTLLAVPVANPDGYQHSWDHDRYWRKNRRDQHGVDLNRNFEVAWGERGASDDPRSPIYHGPSPFSEPESVALRDLLRREKIEGHIDFHSYSQLVLYPWSYTSSAARDRA